MKKGFKTCIGLVLAAVLVFSVTGCKPKPEGPEGPTTGGAVEIPLTDIDLLKAGTSEYRIVVPKDAGQSDAYAGSELSDFFFESTGYRLPVVEDDEVTYDENAKLLSIGQNRLFKQSGITVNEQELNKDGFKIIRKGNMVFLAGATEDGTLYASYEFLQRTLGFRFLAADETVFDTPTDVKLPDFNYTDIPDFAHRNVYFKAIKDNWFIRGRFRSQNNDAWGLFAHSYFQLIPPDTYRADHPDWFSPREGEPTQLCLTSPGLIDELTENLKAKILEKADARYFMVGQEDTNSFCGCSRCTKSNETYGGASGTMMVFINEVARRIAAWQADVCPNRDIYVCTFAYQKTKGAPVKFDAKTDTYSAYAPEVIAEPNVMVQFAPLEACYAHNLFAPCNTVFEAAIRGWQSICDNFAIWSYSTNFTNYLMNFNNFSTLQEDYQIFRDMGTKVFMDQGTGETVASPFHDLRIYLQSQLMWDADCDVNALTEEFMRGYYKDVYRQINDYFTLIRLHYMSLDTDKQASGKGPFDTFVYNSYGISNEQSTYWPKTLLDQCTDIFNEAYGVIDGLQDEKLQETLRRRVLSEQLAIKYLYIQFYYGYYTKEEQFALVDQFEEDAKVCGLVCWKENTPLGEKLTEWRNAIRTR